jgi:serine/threonine protein kinase
MPTDVPADLAAAVADRYDLRRVLGRGGMATVYLAWDRKHHREVALKVLRPDLAASIGSDRFLKEIEIAARLNHPHILPLYDSGRTGAQADGRSDEASERLTAQPPERLPDFLFYVMPFIDGGSLRQRLDAGRIDEAEALAIAEPVADALTYAHRMGVFHRDIKPENILFSQGHPVVGDFGIAKAISTAGGANLTRTGFPLGTPGYMSPEQAAGLTDLDERTDVYSLAIVVYEMIVGEVPGRWPTEEAVRMGRFLDVTAGHRARLAQAGAVIEGALVRGLAIRHDQRTPSPATLMAQLRGAPAPLPPKRQYSEDDVREIMRLAAEREATNPTVSGAMTIGGVEALAADVGLPVDLVRSAARSLDAKTPLPARPDDAPRYNRWIGGPTRLLFDRVVDGEVPDVEFPTMVLEIRRVLRNVGQVSQLGRSFVWTASPGANRRTLEVIVSVRAGQTRISVQENLGPLIGSIFGGIGGGLGGGGMGPIVGVFAGGLGVTGWGWGLIVPMWLFTVFATARSAYYYSARRRARALEELADQLEVLAQELAVPASPQIADPHRPALPRG